MNICNSPLLVLAKGISRISSLIYLLPLLTKNKQKNEFSFLIKK